MKGVTHLTCGFFLSTFFFYINTSLLSQIMLALTCLFASLFPDIDDSNSLLGRYVPVIGFFSTHRGFFHSIFFLALITATLAVFHLYSLALAFALGFLSHLFLDSLTIQGIRIIPGVRLRGFLRSGSTSEYFIQLVFLGLGLLNCFLVQGFSFL